jgi:heptosyltransferase III
VLKILVVRACAIGDFVMNLPALIALQAGHPGLRFTLVGNPSSLELAKEFIAVDAVHSIDLSPWSRLFYETLPALDFDSAVVWMKDPTLAANLVASGIPNVLRADAFPTFGHAADHLLRTLGLPRPSLPDAWNPTSSDIVLHAGSGSAKKNWPFFDELRQRLPDASVLRTDLSLVELSRYLRTIRAFIGNDSGITHIAAYLGCPTLAMFGPTDPRVWGPIGRRSRVLWKSRLEDISVDEVLKVIRGRWPRENGGSPSSRPRRR